MKTKNNPFILNIPFPERLSENDLQVTAVTYLKKHFHFVLTEVKAKTETEKRNCRFDIVVYDNKQNPLFVIEMKKGYKRPKPSKLTKQVKRYRKLLDIPVYQIRGKHELYKLKSIKNNHK